MAESLDDAEFWLPPQFLTDDEIFMDVKNNSKNTKGEKDGGFGFDADASRSLFPYEFTCAFGSLGVPSDLSSPVDSVMGSSETESDEEDYIAGLTLQMARSTLEDGFKNTGPSFGSENGKPWMLSGSPQSTLCAVGGGCGCGQGSSRGSPNAHSRVSSPPETWDLLNAAAGEVAKMRMNEEEYFKFYQSRGLLGPPRKLSPVVNTSSNPDFGYYLNQSASQKQLLATQFQQLRQQQMMKRQNSAMWGATTTQAKLTRRYQMQQAQPVVQNSARNSEFIGTKNSRTVGLSPSAWPPLNQAQSQPNGSGMRAVFLGNPAAKRECAGTGVFLPRQVGAQHETRRKPACSTVLLPARVVQALNLNLDVCAQPQLQPRYNGRFTPDSDVTLRLRSNDVVSNQKRNIRPQQPPVNHEIRLPQDWTY